MGYTGPVGPADATGAPRPTPYMGDRGFAGTHWPAHWANDDAAAVLTQRNYTGEHAPAARRQPSGGRQPIETVNTHLDTVCHLTFPGARTRQGRRARRAAPIAACNRGVWLNQRWHRPTCAFATLTPF